VREVPAQAAETESVTGASRRGTATSTWSSFATTEQRALVVRLAAAVEDRDATDLH